MNKKWLVAILGLSLACLFIAALWRNSIPGESLLMELFRKDARIQWRVWTINIVQVRHAIRLQIVLWSVTAALVGSWWLFPDATRNYWRPRVFRYSIMIGCSVAVFIFFWLKGFEGEWYPIQALMTNPQSVPIFGHRLLWVWLADAIKHLAPSLSYLRCFLLSQMAAAVLTIWMIGRWSALFVGRDLQWIGQVLATMMLSLTFSYYTFYDISITFFFALCLLLLKQRMYVAFVIALAVATLNHENALLLIPVAGLETFSKRRLSAVLCSASAVAHFGVRAILQIFIPFHRQVDWRIWSNLHYPFAHPKEVALSVVSLLFWWIAAAMSWPSAGIFLKRCTLLFPLLFLVTYLVGQFHEARQFDAFIPVVIGFILSELAKHRE